MFSVPILFHDVQEPDCLAMVLDALKHLQNVQNSIFSRISNRVNEEKARLSAINKRVDSCNTKIQAISGSTKATTIFSSAKYPGQKVYRDFIPLFHDLPLMSFLILHLTN